jgi:hypothetical protein
MWQNVSNVLLFPWRYWASRQRIPPCELDNLVWFIDDDPESARWRNGRKANLRAMVFDGPIHLTLLNRFDLNTRATHLNIETMDGTLGGILFPIFATVDMTAEHSGNKHLEFRGISQNYLKQWNVKLN